jgi:hypothetical protein
MKVAIKRARVFRLRAGMPMIGNRQIDFAFIAFLYQQAVAAFRMIKQVRKFV